MRISWLAIFPGLLLLAGGCVRLSPEVSHAYLAPVLSVPELSSAIAVCRIAEGRWPRELPELSRFAEREGMAREYIRQLRSIELMEQTRDTAKYRCLFAGGSSTTLDVKVNVTKAGTAAVAEVDDGT